MRTTSTGTTGRVSPIVDVFDREEYRRSIPPEWSHLPLKLRWIKPGLFFAGASIGIFAISAYLTNHDTDSCLSTSMNSQIYTSQGNEVLRRLKKAQVRETSTAGMFSFIAPQWIAFLRFRAAFQQLARGIPGPYTNTRINKSLSYGMGVSGIIHACLTLAVCSNPEIPATHLIPKISRGTLWAAVCAVESVALIHTYQLQGVIMSSEEQRSIKALPAEFYTAFLSETAKGRKPSPIRSLFPLEHTPGLISLLAGKPNPSTFPFTSFSFTATSPVDDSDISLKIDTNELAQGLQYGATAGHEGLSEWLYGLQEHAHGRKKSADWSLSVGSGSQDLIYKVRDILTVDPK
ncbi:hypothetical protein C0991_007018 [Blastosporella zonata]|nr:hypothetical protein C0991_007018 [Blastosporella zonata]